MPCRFSTLRRLHLPVQPLSGLYATFRGARRAGAAGFLLKAAPPDRLAAAIELVAAGESLLAPTVTQRLIAAYVERPPPSEGIPPPLAVLTEREGEVLALIARGLSNTDIADTLGKSPR